MPGLTRTRPRPISRLFHDDSLGALLTAILAEAATPPPSNVVDWRRLAVPAASGERI